MDIDSLFSLFLNNYLRIFYTSFPLHNNNSNSNKNKSWITTAIKFPVIIKKTFIYLVETVMIVMNTLIIIRFKVPIIVLQLF
jgi:hypothetical protein